MVIATQAIEQATPLEVPQKAQPFNPAASKYTGVHPERFCPNCSSQLQERKCKLICPACAYYLSCSDFY
jgi:Zn finger protein HypA/HybF involved in hydrogenase expression